MRFLRFISVLVALALAAAHAQTVVLTPSTTTLDAAGGTVTFTATFTYNTAPSVLGVSIDLPSGWAYLTGTNEPGSIKPSEGQQGTLEWAYVTAPQTAPSFTFTAAYPASVATLQNLAATSIVRPGEGATPVTTTNPPIYIESASTAVTWNANATGDWSNAQNWSPARVPSNNQTEAFSVTMGSGNANLTTAYAINNLTFTGGVISGTGAGNGSSLSLNGLNSTWLGGVFSELSSLALSTGARLTASGSDAHVFDHTSIFNYGEFIWTDTGSLSSSGGTFVNGQGGTFTDTTSIIETYTQLSILAQTAATPPSDSGGTEATLAVQNPTYGTFANAGTYLKSAPSETRISANFANSGTLAINSGLLTIDGDFAQSTGKLLVGSGSALKFNGASVIAAGSLTGSGTIHAATGLINNGFISPGDSVLGRLTVNGDLSLLSASNLFFDIGGTNQGVTYDALVVFGTAALSGHLQLNLVDNALATLSALDTLTILNATALNGTFTNLTDGMRIFTLDNAASFRLNYTANTVTLSDFQATVVPEPSTWALLITGAGAIGFRALRRRQAA